MSRPRDLPQGSTTAWVAVAALQVVVVTVLALVWGSGESDSSATTVDRAFVALILGTPAALATSSAAGWWVRRRGAPPASRTVRVLARSTHWCMLALLAPAAVLALPLAAMAVFVEPIG